MNIFSLETRLNRAFWWALACVLCAANPVSAGMADKITHANVSGIDVYTYPMSVKDVVTFEGSLPAGDAQSAQDGNLLALTYVGGLLSRGTTRHDKDAIARELANMGAQIQFEVDEQALRIRASALKQDLPRVIRLLAEELRSPAFVPAEFELAKTQFEGELLEAQEDSDERAQGAFSRALYAKGHPNRADDLESLLEASRRLTLTEVKTFYRKYYGPAHMKLVFAGDVDTAVVEKEVREAFAGWSGGEDYVRTAPANPVNARREQTIPLKDKESVTVIWGQRSGLRYRDADRLALAVGTAVLGNGFTSRLVSTVRVKEGLTYGISASMQEDDFLDGTWAISSSFAPELLDKGIESTRRELDKWWRDGVTQDELEATKSNLIGSYHIRYSNTRSVVSQVMSLLDREMSLSWLDDYPQMVSALTLEQVNGAIRKYLDPKKMVLVKAGTVRGGAVKGENAKANVGAATPAMLSAVVPTLKIGDPAPAIQPMAWIRGQPIATFEPGRAYVVEFWASWCGPCNAVMPHLSSLQKKYKDRLTVVGINVRESEGATADLQHVAAFVKKKGAKMDYTVAMDDPARNTVFDAWMTAGGLYGIPAACVVDATGRVVWMGYSDDDKLAVAVKQALDGNSDLAVARELQKQVNLDTAKRLRELSAPRRAG